MCSESLLSSCMANVVLVVFCSNFLPIPLNMDLPTTPATVSLSHKEWLHECSGHHGIDGTTDNAHYVAIPSPSFKSMVPQSDLCSIRALYSFPISESFCRLRWAFDPFWQQRQSMNISYRLHTAPLLCSQMMLNALLWHQKRGPHNDFRPIIHPEKLE